MAERVPQIELRAPGAFDDPDRPVISEIQFDYQVNATVLLPLLFVSYRSHAAMTSGSGVPHHATSTPSTECDCAPTNSSPRRFPNGPAA